MSQVVTAVYEDGVFKPTEPLDLAPHTTVQLTVEVPEETDRPTKEERLAILQRLWSQTKAHGAPHLTRDELHERR
jgi:predicted DNA-binding antitoxin AbrB/MazE fold protein